MIGSYAVRWTGTTSTPDTGDIMKLSGSPRTEFVIKSPTAIPQYVRNWPTKLDPQYTPDIGEAIKFSTREEAGRFLLQSTYDAGRRNSQWWNSGLIVVQVQETRNWEEVEVG